MTEPRVIHRDLHWLIVHKPPGLPTTSPAAGRACLHDWARQHLEGHAYVHPTSRLDSSVSGVVTFALSKAANAHLLRARAESKYGRVYFGITLSERVSCAQDWTWPISIDPNHPKIRRAGPGKGERPAHTRCDEVIRAEHGSLLRLLPRTGRTHQIRVHAARAGAPLFGDTQYGAERRFTLPTGRVVAAPRVMLHCAQVSFPSMDGAAMQVFTAPCDPDFREVWRLLGGEEPALQLSCASSSEDDF